VVEAFRRLIPQLSTSASPPDRQVLSEIISAPSNTVLLARDGSDGARIVGALTLVMFRIPTALRAWIEDVVRGFGGARARRRRGSDRGSRAHRPGARRSHDRSHLAPLPGGRAPALREGRLCGPRYERVSLCFIAPQKAAKPP
jgi:hypothetical protein